MNVHKNKQIHWNDGAPCNKKKKRLLVNDTYYKHGYKQVLLGDLGMRKYIVKHIGQVPFVFLTQRKHTLVIMSCEQEKTLRAALQADTHATKVIIVKVLGLVDHIGNCTKPHTVPNDPEPLKTAIEPVVLTILKLNLYFKVLPEQIHHYSLHVTSDATAIPAGETNQSVQTQNNSAGLL